MTGSIRTDPGCPICARPAVEEFRPFCSRRCADVDLGRWLTGQYRIPITPEETEEDPTGESA
jgi:endogenous inhibitor of DNA gyrase (YacG/DUF329 family)